jgi:ubiquitin carboxyl-terminal hydrolase 4/11/15
MDPETTANKNDDAANGSTEDVEMTSSISSAELPRAMSVDVVEVSDTKPSINGTDNPAQCKFISWRERE